MLRSLKLLDYEWKPPQSCRVYMEPQSMFPVALSLSTVICCILHTSVPLFPSPVFECKEMLAIVDWLWKCHLDPYQLYHIPCTHTPLTNHRAHHCGFRDVNLAITPHLWKGVSIICGTHLIVFTNMAVCLVKKKSKKCSTMWSLSDWVIKKIINWKLLMIN